MGIVTVELAERIGRGPDREGGQHAGGEGRISLWGARLVGQLGQIDDEIIDRF